MAQLRLAFTAIIPAGDRMPAGGVKRNAAKCVFLRLLLGTAHNYKAIVGRQARVSVPLSPDIAGYFLYALLYCNELRMSTGPQSAAQPRKWQRGWFVAEDNRSLGVANRSENKVHTNLTVTRVINILNESSTHIYS